MDSPAVLFGLGADIAQVMLTNVTGAPRSSNLRSVGYDEDRQVMEVVFANGARWRYVPVPRSAYGRILGAESPGRVFMRTVRDRYRSLRIEETPDGEIATAAPPERLGAHVEIVPDRPPPPKAPYRRQTAGSGTPAAVFLNDASPIPGAPDPVHVRGADGSAQAPRPCDVCGGPTRMDYDASRADAGLMRCDRGHMNLSIGVDVSALEI